MRLKNKQIKLFFKNGATAEGIVSHWGKENVILKTLNSENILIIYEPQQNIMMVLVVNDKIEKNIEQPIVPKIKPIKQLDAIEQLNAIKQPNAEELTLDHFEPDPTLRAKKLAELRKMQLKEHKQDVGKHLTSWKIDNKNSFDPEKNFEATYYGIPNITNTSSIGSAKEGNRSDVSDIKRLRRMQKKESKA